MKKNNNKIFINNSIKKQWVYSLLILINSLLIKNSYIFIFLIIIFIYYKKHWFIVLLLPSIKNKILEKPINIKTTGIIHYSVKTKCNKKNIYVINIYKTENFTRDIGFLKKQLGIFLYAKSEKDYFHTYKSKIYIINENFLIESNVISCYKSIYKCFLEKIYYRVIYYCKYYSITNSLLLSIKEGNKIFHLFKTTGTWHLLCVGGLHIHILKNIFNFIKIIIFELAFKFTNGLNILNIISYIEFIIISLFGLINSLNSYSVPTLRASSSYIIYNYFYLNNNIINPLFIFLLVILGFLFINGNYIYDLGFQMSFLSVYFLLGFSDLLYKIKNYIIKKINVKWFINLVNLFIINFFIGFLLIGYNFFLHKSFNILSLFANMILIPIFYIIIILNFLGLLHIFFWNINKYFIFICVKILHVFNHYSINIYCSFNKNEIFLYGYLLFILISFFILIRIYINKYYFNKQIEDKFLETSNILYIY